MTSGKINYLFYMTQKLKIFARNSKYFFVFCIYIIMNENKFVNNIKINKNILKVTMPKALLCYNFADVTNFFVSYGLCYQDFKNRPNFFDVYFSSTKKQDENACIQMEYDFASKFGAVIKIAPMSEIVLSTNSADDTQEVYYLAKNLLNKYGKQFDYIYLHRNLAVVVPTKELKKIYNIILDNIVNSKNNEKKL